jgi:hypothetical protein
MRFAPPIWPWAWSSGGFSGEGSVGWGSVATAPSSRYKAVVERERELRDQLEELVDELDAEEID